MKVAAGIDMLHVPYTGANNANIIGDLLANRVQVYFPAYPATLAALPTGKIKLLGMFFDQRTKQRPDLPTVKETLPNLTTVPSWFGFMGPAGLPAPIVARLQTEIRKALEDPEISRSSKRSASFRSAAPPRRWRPTAQADRRTGAACQAGRHRAELGQRGCARTQLDVRMPHCAQDLRAHSRRLARRLVLAARGGPAGGHRATRCSRPRSPASATARTF